MSRSDGWPPGPTQTFSCRMFFTLPVSWLLELVGLAFPNCRQPALLAAGCAREWVWRYPSSSSHESNKHKQGSISQQATS